MPHASVDNGTPFVLDAFHLMDEAGRPLVVPLLKATFDLSRGEPRLAEPQAPIELAGTRWADDDASSFRVEPECTTFFKPATDVVLVGHAHAPTAGAKESTVALRAGSLRKVVRVVGDRSWVRSRGAFVATAPLAFDRIPLSWEHALGGWDRTDPDPAKHTVEARNPVGVGYRAAGAAFEEGPLPNLEDPDAPLSAYGQHPSPPPAGFGFVGHGWATRARFAGTYDAAWLEHKMPLLPDDFDRRFFNGAAPGLVADGWLEGGEAFVVEGASASGRLAFTLPKVRPPECRVGIRRRPDAEVAMHLDTIVVDTDAMTLCLLWRGHAALPDGAHDVRWIAVR